MTKAVSLYSSVMMLMMCVGTIIANISYGLKFASANL